ncbi:colicin immunity domain-containing protein [Siccibacter turicensis]|mgnify:FL=1|uniref:colicin immunity domain-containing protein n=1 Tax=Siccibacter turicensis TaxID=357233 RepID=UPI002A6B5BE2|nr:colicin immunity domain-containing protein [Siccibacter turicensis]MDY0969998.1 colicin immunity domain-containing protein [Siccibacter turicensis]
MSFELKNYIDKFLAKEITVDEFSDNYMSMWRQERNNSLLLEDEGNLSELLSSAFCAADMYNPDGDREEYEFDEDKLRDEINKLVCAYLSK